MKNTKYNVAVTAFIALFAAGTLGADAMMQNSMPVSQQVNSSNMASDQKVGLVANRVDQITTKNVNGTLGGKLPSYLYDSGYVIDIDYLYWRTDEEGLAYAVLTQPSGAFNSVQSFRNERIDAGFDSGFRLGMGYTFSNTDMWDLFVNWTYFHNTERTSTSIDSLNAGTALSGAQGLTGQAFMSSPWGSNIFPDAISDAEGRWRLNYNTVDVDLGRDFFIGKSLTLRPHCGLRAAWLYQDYNIAYDGFYEQGGGFFFEGSQAASFLPGSGTYHGESNFHGVGLRTGADMRWAFTRSWAFITKFSASWLYGRFQTSATALGNQLGPTDTLTPTTYVGRNNYNAMRPELEAVFGIEWAGYFYHDKYRFAVDVAWEEQFWFEQNEFIVFQQNGEQVTAPNASGTGLTGYRFWTNTTLPTRDANLAIQGLTVKFNLSF